jgi:hypothetical protein
MAMVFMNNEGEMPLLVGKSVPSLLSSVTGLIEPGSAGETNLHKDYTLEYIFPDHDTFFWAGSSTIVIIVEDGTVVDVRYLIG